MFISVLTSLMHPRLFSSLILLEPVFDAGVDRRYGHALTRMSTLRQDKWPSHKEATKAARKIYKNWDERVMRRWLRHGYRTVPTAIHPELPESPTGHKGTLNSPSCSFDIDDWMQHKCPGDGFRDISSEKILKSVRDEKPVTLATTKHQEVFSYLRPNFKGITQNSGSIPGPHERSILKSIPTPIAEDLDRMQMSDVIGPPASTAPFYRAEPVIAHLALPHIRPPVLYVFGGKSPASTHEKRKTKVESTGVGIGGSGGRVKEVVIQNGSHMAPMENIGECADAVVPWCGEVVAAWKVTEARMMKEWEGKSVRERSTVSSEWVEKVKSLL
jgi:pimeloyl-ACP methyl ester carboxylesterase